MKRGVFDLLRRGFDNTVANWQVSLIRFLQAFLFLAIAVGALFVILVPVLVSVGIRVANIKTPADFESAVALLLSQWMLLVWIVLGLTVMLLLFMLVYSFVEAGCARVLVDADRIAGPELLGPRSRYRVFSLDRWLAGAKDGFWTVFWIYNGVWGLAGLVMLIPLLPTAALMVVFRNEPAVAVTAGCLGLAITVLFLILIGFVTSMWGSRAIVSWAAYRTGVAESMRIAWQAVKTDLGRHLLIALGLIVVAMAGSAFFSSFSMFAGLGESIGRNHTFLFMTLPLRLVGSLLNSAFSAAVGSWYLASYAALAIDAHRT